MKPLRHPLGPPNYGLDPGRVEVMLNPTVAGGLRFWDYRLLGKPRSDEAVLAGIHKARVMWRGSTPAMIAESKRWLITNGFQVP